MALSKQLRKRAWTIQRSFVYDRDGTHYTGIDKEEWRSMIESEWTELSSDDGVLFSFFIFHDKDRKIDETTGKPALDVNGFYIPVELHAHAVVYFKNPRTLSAVASSWTDGNERNVSPVDNRKGGIKSACRYLLHITDTAISEGKYLYGEDELYQFGEQYHERAGVSRATRTQIKTVVDNYCNDIALGRISYLDAVTELHNLYPASDLIRYKSSLKTSFESRGELETRRCQESSEKGEFRRLSIYVRGRGGIGKSIFASCLGRALGGSCYTVPNTTGGRITSDFTDGFGFENATVFDDLHFKNTSYQGFLQRHDTTRFAIQESRFKNKPWTSTYAIITHYQMFGSSVLDMLLNDFHSDADTEFREMFHITTNRTVYLSDDHAVLFDDTLFNQMLMAARRFRFQVEFLDDYNGSPALLLYEFARPLPSTQKALLQRVFDISPNLFTEIKREDGSLDYRLDQGLLYLANTRYFYDLRKVIPLSFPDYPEHTSKTQQDFYKRMDNYAQAISSFILKEIEN